MTKVFLRSKEVSAGCKNSRLGLWRPFLVPTTFYPTEISSSVCLMQNDATVWWWCSWNYIFFTFVGKRTPVQLIFESMQCWISGLISVPDPSIVLPKWQDTKSKTMLQFVRMCGYFQFQCKREPAVALLSVIKWLGDRKGSQLFPPWGEMSENQCKPNAPTRWLGWWDQGWGDPP